MYFCFIRVKKKKTKITKGIKRKAFAYANEKW